MIRKKRMGKGIAKILSGLLVFGMVAGLVPAVPGGTVHAKAAEISGQNATTEPHTHCVCGTGELSVEGHKQHKEETWIGISDFREIDISTKGYYYYLKDDVTIDQVWKCPRGVTLCLNGHSITRTSVNSGSVPYEKAVIYINSKFTLTDCKKNGIIKHEVKNTGAGVYNDGTFTMFNGNMSDNYHGVSNNETFQMYGGTISGNAAEVGGGVYNDGTFNMYGGTITDNQESAYGGGGVYNVKTFNMFGGTITQNHGSNNGGGVYNGETFNMYGGEITANTTTNDGGGVYIFKGTFTMSGGQIANNKARRGGGVYNEGGTFEMSGGTISGNTADSSNGYPAGGGVYNATGTFNMSGGEIKGNKSGTSGGGVYNAPDSSAKIIMSGQAEISNNQAASAGGGVFVSANDATTLSEAVKITENKVGNTANNLYLSSDTTLQAGCLNGSEAIVGVTTEKEPTENSPVTITSDDARTQGFRSDRDEYELEYSNGHVVMKKKKTCTVKVIIPKDNSVIKQQGSGELEQTVTEGSNIIPIVLEAATGYYFKDEDISKLNTASVKVTKLVDDGSRIKIECTPNNDIYISLLAFEKPDTTHTITATVEGENGTISPSGPVSVNKGDDKKFTITPSEGYVIASLKVDGTEVENPSNTYTFTNVTSNRTIVVSFKAKDVVPPVVEKPKIITQPQPASVKAGETATFTVEAAGEGLRYQWQIKAGKGGWDDITDANTSSYTTTAVVPNCNGFEYRCVVSNSAGSVYSDSATLTVDTTIPPTPEPNPEPKPEPTPTPTPAPNPTPEATTPTPNPAPATSTPAASTSTAPASSAAAAPVQVTYDILDGAGSSWTQNTDGSLAIRGSGEISKFREVKVDGVTVDPVNYTVTEGSTIITFKPEYLKSLSAGNHSFELVWTDGTAATNFTVAENTDQSAKSPKTGEDFSMALCTALLMVSCAGLAGIFAKRKRNHAR